MQDEPTGPEPSPPTSLSGFLSAVDDADAELGDTDTDLGSRIEEAREATGMDREALGAQVGVGAGTVANWESGERPPRSNQIVSIAGVLGGSPSWLMTGLGEAPTIPSTLASVAPELAEIRAELEDLTRRIGRLLDALADTAEPIGEGAGPS